MILLKTVPSLITPYILGHILGQREYLLIGKRCTLVLPIKEKWSSMWHRISANKDHRSSGASKKKLP